MEKKYAIKLLGGTTASAAEALGITYQAVNKWPEVLSSAISDRVVAAVARTDPESWPENWVQISESLQFYARSSQERNPKE